MTQDNPASGSRQISPAPPNPADLNAPETAVGVPHPENILSGQSVPAISLGSAELDDYDDDKQRTPPPSDLPLDQDPGESFPGIIDIGDTASDHAARSDSPGRSEDAERTRPTVDNQVNQPDRFHNANRR